MLEIKVKVVNSQPKLGDVKVVNKGFTWGLKVKVDDCLQSSIYCYRRLILNWILKIT